MSDNEHPPADVFHVTDFKLYLECQASGRKFVPTIRVPVEPKLHRHTRLAQQYQKNLAALTDSDRRAIVATPLSGKEVAALYEIAVSHVAAIWKEAGGRKGKRPKSS